MIFRREIGEKGQVVIPVDIRRMLGIKSGEQVIFEIKGNNVLVKSAQDPEEFLKEFFNVEKLEKPLAMKDIKKTILERRNYGIS